MSPSPPEQAADARKSIWNKHICVFHTQSDAHVGASPRIFYTVVWIALWVARLLLRPFLTKSFFADSHPVALALSGEFTSYIPVETNVHNSSAEGKYVSQWG